MKLTTDYLIMHALENPQKVALIDHEQQISYGQFRRDLCKVISVLQSYDLPKDSRVAVEWTRLYSHWLLLLACERLGYVSFSFTRDEFSSHVDFLNGQDVIFVSDKLPLDVAQIQINKDFMWKVNQCPETEKMPVSPFAPNDNIRVQCSSGTTGSQKYMYRTAQLHAYRIDQAIKKDGYSANSQLMIFNAFGVHGAYSSAFACLQRGGTIVHDNQNAIAIMQNQKITHLSLLPATVIGLLKACPSTATKPENLVISTFGGKLPSDIRVHAKKILATNIIESYATNEVGFISLVDDQNLGQILPDVTVEILNDDNEPIYGELGRIRLKSPAQINGYIDNEAASAEMFHEGWFYPGDFGIMPDKQHLKMVGRKDDLVNFRGVKYNTSEMEEYIRPHIDADDFCVIGHINANLEEEIWIVVQPHSTTILDQLKSILLKLAPQTNASLRLKKIKNLPRTSTGKVLRNELLLQLG